MKEGIVKVLNHINRLTLDIANSKNKTFLTFCFCFIISASLFSWLEVSSADTLLFYPDSDSPESRILDFAPQQNRDFFISLFLFLFLAVIFWSNKLYRLYILGIFFFLLGATRVMFAIPDCGDKNNICYYNGRKIELTGWVSDEPDRRIEQTYYVVNVSSINNFQAVVGKILLKTRNYPEYFYGDKLAIACSLSQPEHQEDEQFRYDKYLAKQGIWSLCMNPRINRTTPQPLLPTTPAGKRKEGTVGRLEGVIPAKAGIQSQEKIDPRFRGDDSEIVAFGTGQFLMKQIFNFKLIIQNQIEKLWPEPESSFMAGLLYGSKSGLPAELMQAFSRTGITHIIAVSGFNITIIATVLMNIGIALGLWRRQAFWMVIGSLIFFVIFTGASASVVRAASMGILALTAQYLGRLSKMFTALTFAAAIMLALNPYVLVWDAGFQLSFLATIGLVYVSPVLNRMVSKEEDPAVQCHSRESGNPQQCQVIDSHFRGNDTLKWFGITVGKFVEPVKETLFQTLSAIIVTLPLILYQFGRLSLVAPLVNILVLWTIPWLMLFGFIAIIVSFIIYPLGQLVAWVALIGMKYVVFIASWFGNQSWSSVDLSLPWWVMVGLYLLLFFIIKKCKLP